MKGTAVVRAGRRRDGTCRLIELRSTPLLTMRVTDDGIYLVSAAGGPLGGDELELVVEVGDGCSLTLRSVGAALFRPGPGPGQDPARARVTASVGEAACLIWEPQPAIAGAACNLDASARVELADGARLRWLDEVVLGRFGESPGRWSSTLVVDLAGTPLLRQRLAVGPGAPGWDGPAVVGRARAVGQLLSVGYDVNQTTNSHLATVMALAGDRGTLVSATAANYPDLHMALLGGCRIGPLRERGAIDE